MATWKQRIQQQRGLLDSLEDELQAFDYHLRRGFLLAIQTLDGHGLNANSFGCAAAAAMVESSRAMELWSDLHCIWPQVGIVELGHVTGNSAAQSAIVFLCEYQFLLNFRLHLVEFPETKVDDVLWGAFNRMAKTLFPGDHRLTLNRFNVLLSSELSLFKEYETLNMIRAIRLKNSGKTWQQVWESVPNEDDKHYTYKRTVKRWHDDNQEVLSKIGLTLDEGKPGTPKKQGRSSQS